MTIESHRHCTLGLVFALTAMVACTPKQSAAPAEASPPELAAPERSSTKDTKVTPAPPKRAPRPKALKAPKDGLHLLRTTGSVEGPLPYTLVGPSNDAPDLPIILAFHGRGDRAEGFCRLVEGLRLPYRFVVAEAPMRWGLGSGKSWFDMKSPERAAQLAARVQDIMTLSQKVRARWPEAPEPALLGFSQGAMLVLQTIAAHPEHFRGAVALSGSLLEPKALKATPSGRPIFLSAGKRDQVIPRARSEAAFEALRALGHQPELFVFEGGHRVTKPVVAKVQSALKGWFESPSTVPRTK